MPALLMPTKSFIRSERELLEKIEIIHKELIDKVEGKAEIWIIGREQQSNSFWEDFVLNDDDKKIIDPFDGLPIEHTRKLTHFAVVSVNNLPDQEFYFGNKNFGFSEYVRAVLLRAIRINTAVESDIPELV